MRHPCASPESGGSSLEQDPTTKSAVSAAAPDTTSPRPARKRSRALEFMWFRILSPLCDGKSAHARAELGTSFRGRLERVAAASARLLRVDADGQEARLFAADV